MSCEIEKESVIRSAPLRMDISLQKLKRGGNNLPVPDAVNYYQGEATFGKTPKFRKIFEKVNWRRFLWEFDLGGFAEMCFVDPGHLTA